MEGAARIILRDWATNTFPYVSTAPKSTAAAVTGQADMTAVLAACRSRKEMRATGKGLIKFQGGDVDSREVSRVVRVESPSTRSRAIAMMSKLFIKLNSPNTKLWTTSFFNPLSKSRAPSFGHMCSFVRCMLTIKVILDDDFIAMAGPSDDEDEDDDDEELDEEELDDDEDAEEDLEALILSAEDGDEVELEDGPEPSSGSDVEEEDDDDEEESEEDEEEIIEKSPTPPPVAQKRKRKSDIAPVTAASAKKAKRVSFGKNEIRVMEAQPSRGKGSKRKR